MKIKILSVTLLTLTLFAVSNAQTPDKAKLNQFFDWLAEKNKARESLVIAKDGQVLYTRVIGYSQINGSEKKHSSMQVKTGDVYADSERRPSGVANAHPHATRLTWSLT